MTILKAWFNESTKLVDIGLTPVQPTDDGLNLVPYLQTDAEELTVGGELNKVASNVALGRNMRWSPLALGYDGVFEVRRADRY